MIYQTISCIEKQICATALHELAKEIHPTTSDESWETYSILSTKTSLKSFIVKKKPRHQHYPKLQHGVYTRVSIYILQQPDKATLEKSLMEELENSQE